MQLSTFHSFASRERDCTYACSSAAFPAALLLLLLAVRLGVGVCR